jgi:hypothetical protein
MHLGLQPCFDANSIPITTPLRAPSLKDFPLDIKPVIKDPDVFDPEVCSYSSFFKGITFMYLPINCSHLVAGDC